MAGYNQQADPNAVRLWVSRVTYFSSQYDDEGWSANSVIGPPKVFPQYGDLEGSWAPGFTDENQFLELGFPEKIFIREIHIFETYHAGGTKRIQIKQPNGEWLTIMENPEVKNIQQSRIFSPFILPPDFASDEIRLEVDCSACGYSWVEIDAVEIVGTRSNSIFMQHIMDSPFAASAAQKNQTTIRQWASKVINYSSQYDDAGWSAKSATGAPRVYPKHGDISGAWAPESLDNNQFVELEYDEMVHITEINIYETYHAGGVRRVLAKDLYNMWVILWEKPYVEDITQARIFSVPLQGRLVFPTDQLRLEVDCTACGTYVEIDAVEIVGERSSVQKPYRGEVPVYVNSYEPEEIPVINRNQIRQWVAEVLDFSSEYDSVKWPASSVIGKPTVYPKYGDIPGAWAQEVKDANQYIEVAFEKKVFMSEINIYETYHGGRIKRILTTNPDSEWVTVYENPRLEDIKQSRIFSLKVEGINFPADHLRIEIDCGGKFVEIDAVELVGSKADDKGSSICKESILFIYLIVLAFSLMIKKSRV